MIFDWIKNMMWMLFGYFFGFVIGISIGIIGLAEFYLKVPKGVLFISLLMIFLGIITLYLFLRNDLK